MRWLGDPVFGRCFAEGRAIGNGLNFHEGLQFHSSVFAALFLIAGAIRGGSLAKLSASIAFFGIMIWFAMRIGPFAYVLGPLLAGLALLGLHRELRARKQRPNVELDLDMAFHVWILSAALAAILVPEIRTLIYHVWLKRDFMHSRIAVAALPSVSILIALFMSELLPRQAGETPPRWKGAITVAASLVVASALFVTAAKLRWWLAEWIDWGTATQGLALSVVPDEVGRFAAYVVAFVGLLTVYAIAGARSRIASVAVTTLGCLMVMNAFHVAHYQVAGPQAWTFPVPFKDNNYLMAPPGAMAPPTCDERAGLRDKLESEKYRTAAVSYPAKYAPFVEPHLAEFWGIRLTGGYGAGVPCRLAVLPWPNECRSLRAVRISHEGEISWPLLAFLNTKHVIVVDDNLYYNVSRGSSDEGNRIRACSLDGTANSEWATAIVVPACQAVRPPTDIRVQRTADKQATVRWRGLADTRYELEQADVLPRRWTHIGTTAPGVGSYCVTLTDANAQAFRLRASDKRGMSIHSEPVWIPPAPGADDESGTRLRAMGLDDPLRMTIVEGFPVMEASFDDAGDIQATYQHDRIALEVSPSQSPRFLVLNELYHRRWRAFADGREVPVYPANLCMRGVLVPAGVSRIDFKYQPFLHTPVGIAIMGAGLLLALGVWHLFRRVRSRLGHCGTVEVRMRSRRHETYRSGPDADHQSSRD